MNGGVELLRKGIVDDADERFELVGKGERDGHVGEGVNEVGGAVDGIDYESWRGRQTRRGCGRLFAQETNMHGSVISIQGFRSCYPVRVVRISGCEGPGHHILDGFISLSDKIRSYEWLFSRVSARCATKKSSRCTQIEKRTIHFCIDGGRIGGNDHPAGLLGQTDEKIMDFFKIGFRHLCSHVCDMSDGQCRGLIDKQLRSEICLIRFFSLSLSLGTGVPFIPQPKNPFYHF